MDKRLIAERFTKARGTYDREARVQQQVAERMMRLVLQHTGGDAFRFRNVVEFGCGTGSYSPREDRLPATAWFVSWPAMPRNWSSLQGPT